jgi:hypothetical protein
MVDLVRRWCVDWLARADARVCEEILAPDYTLLIGGFTLGPREAYIEATLKQLGRFPGLGLTVHELIAAEDHVALRFTEHGASPKHGEAAWRGIALFRWDGSRLSECFAEEDYYGRRRQFDTGSCDPIDPPAAAPWNSVPLARDAAAEQVVRDWLDAGDLGVAALDDGRPFDVELEGAEVNELFSAGSRVAFHGRLGGALHLAGLVEVRNGEVVGGHVIRDRLGLSRA